MSGGNLVDAGQEQMGVFGTGNRHIYQRHQTHGADGSQCRFGP